jgi:hypothetical protein
MIVVVAVIAAAFTCVVARFRGANDDQPPGAVSQHARERPFSAGDVASVEPPHLEFSWHGLRTRSRP